MAYTDNITIYLRVKSDSASEARIVEKTLLPSEVIHLYRKLGGGLKGSDVLRGLTSAEEKLLLPGIIGVTPDQQGFVDAVRNFWKNITINVPYHNDENKGGLPLEVGFEYETEEGMKIGMQEDKTEWNTYLAQRKLGKTYEMKFNKRHEHGRPINPIEYITYRFALVKSSVANTPEEVNNSPKKIMFFIDNPQRKKESELKQLSVKKKAYALYLDLADDEGKLLDIATVLHKELGVNTSITQIKTDDVETKLEQFVHKNPNHFISVFEDDSLRVRAFVERAIAHGILRRLPLTETIFYGETMLLGNTTNEVIGFLTNDTNAGIAEEIKARLKMFNQ